ncbi:unnamed protein product [Chrysoparadoxa australica]
MDNFIELVEGEEIVAEAVHDLVEGAAEEVRLKSLNDLAAPFAALKALEQAFNLVDWGLLSHDTPDTVGELKEPPLPPPEIDTWARSHVPLRCQPCELLDMSVSSPKAPSESGQSRRSLSSKNRRQQPPSGNSTSGPRSHSRKKSSLDHVPLIELGNSEQQYYAGGGGRPGPEHNTAPAACEELDSLTQKAKFEEQLAAKLEEEELAVKMKVESLRKELKNQEWTWDDDGEVLVITRLSGDKLKKVYVDVPAEVKQEPVPKKAGRQKQNKGKASETKEAKEVRHSKAEAPLEVMRTPTAETEKYFQMDVSCQPSLLDGNCMQLEEGVDIHENGSVKTGPSPRKDPNRMTRKQYETLASSPMSQVCPSVGGSSLHPSVHAFPLGEGLTPNATPRVASASAAAAVGPRAATPGTPALSVETFDLLADGARQEDPVTCSDEDDLESCPIWQQFQSGEARSPGTNRPVPPPLARKPGSRERHEVREQRIGPRDRGNPENICPTALKKRLPQPPPGATMGHGLMPKATTAGASDEALTLPSIDHKGNSGSNRDSEPGNLLVEPHARHAAAGGGGSVQPRKSERTIKHLLGETLLQGRSG